MAKKIFSTLIGKIQPSGTIALTDKVRELKKMGKDIVDLTVGEPDFDTPDDIKQAAIKALMEGKTKYGASAGLPELRELIAKKLNKENGMHAESKNIIVTPGAKQALVYAFMILLDEGDEVLVPDPYWVSYPSMIGLAGGVAVSIPSNKKNNFKINAKDIEQLITPKTKILVLVNPNNPTGTLLQKKDLESIAEVVKRHDLFVVTDEVYEKIVFDNKKYVSFASLPEMEERTITVNGFSKTFAMTGWRLGYACAPKSFIDKMLILQQQMATCPNAFAQYGAIFSLSHKIREVAVMVKKYEKRRNKIVKDLNKIKPYSCFKPAGTFYLFLNIKGFGKPSMKIAEELLDKVYLATVPGSSFGKAGEGYLRLSFATSDKNLEEAVRRFKRYAELTIEKGK
jgi:aspartate/methionine/tyrosine aminotransferase